MNKILRSFKDASACPCAAYTFFNVSGEIGLLRMTGEAVALLYPSRANNTVGALVGLGKPANPCMKLMAAEAITADDLRPD